MCGRPFLCESSLRGQWVDVRFDPGELSSVLILRDGERLQRALPQIANALPETVPTEERIEATVDYLSLIRRDYDAKLLAHARPLAYADLTVEPGFDVERFLAVAFGLGGLDPGPAERRQLVDFWESFGPLPEDLVRIAMEHAVRMHGRGRHAHVYLHALRTLVLAHWRGRTKKEER